jgi:hypothetical protein
VGFADVAGKVAAQIEKQARVLVDVAGAIILGSAGLSGITWHGGLKQIPDLRAPIFDMLTLEMRVDPHHQARPPGDEPYRLSEAVLAKGREPKALRGLRRKRKNAQTHRLVPPPASARPANVVGDALARRRAKSPTRPCGYASIDRELRRKHRLALSILFADRLLGCFGK